MITMLYRVVFFCIVFSAIQFYCMDSPAPERKVEHTINNYSKPILVETNTPKDLKCLIETIYWEAGNQGTKGMSAVARVVMNRVTSGRYPATICEVVYQPRQFTWVDVVPPHKRKEITDLTVHNIAINALEGIFVDEVNEWYDVMHYHATYIKKPVWAKKKEVKAVLGQHVFYRQ